jgi:DnaJ-class molecular chaperone
MRRNRSRGPNDPVKERDCPGCNGTGFVAVVQPKQPGRRIFAPRCSKCEGKGKVPLK